MNKKDLRAERKNQRVEENRLFILNAAETVFAQKGFNQATVDDISEEAQFSKATLYRYFNSKREIFIDIILNTFNSVNREVKEILEMEIEPEEKLKVLIHTILSYYQKKKNIARIFFMEQSSIKKIMNMEIRDSQSQLPFHPGLPKNFISKMKEISNSIGEIIKEGIKTEKFRKVDVKDAGFIFGAMLRGFYFKGPIQDKEYSVEESTELLHSFFLDGIRYREKTEKGE